MTLLATIPLFEDISICHAQNLIYYQQMKILGIESSCDETAASVVENGRVLLSNVVNSQIDIHALYGGVVPEIAARSHIEVVNPVINQALIDANCTWDDIDAIAVTYAPGLIGSLLVGTLAARTLAVLKNKPLFPIHHVEAHVYANFITEQRLLGENKSGSTRRPRAESETVDMATVSEPRSEQRSNSLLFPARQPEFPMLALIVSGGHSQLVLFRDHGDYELLGQTEDDAVGEAFDKVAKILGYPYPGGPSIAKAALEGDPQRYKLPKSILKCTHQGSHLGMAHNTNKERCNYYNFSFSGLKTAVLRAVQREVGVDFTFPSHELAALLNDTQRHDFAASFQYTAISTLVDKAERAFHDFSPKSVVIAGGVAANQELRRQLSERLPLHIDYAPINLCTDNAAMIATLGYYYAQKKQPVDPFELEVVPSLSMTKTTW
jgi:N6-L-threonylcarbamoyladenine synthase